MKPSEVSIQTGVVLSPEDALIHWQGHRRLTRKVIEAFPEDKFFNYSIGGMRPFSEMTMEFLKMTVPGVKGIATGQWEEFDKGDFPGFEGEPSTKADFLKLWDWSTEQIEAWWPKISADRFQVHETAFGMYDGSNRSHLFYFIDNEIHHRGQGYVYLRSLGIAPPAFWER